METNEIRSADQANRVYPFLVAMVAAVGGFLFGFDLSIVSGAAIFLRKQYDLDAEALGFAVSCALLGCMLGPILVALGIGDRFGRKKILILMALLFGISAVGTALARNMFEFNLFRIVGGVGVGVASIVSPMYIAEIAPARIRGRLVIVNQLAIVIGALCSAVIAYLLTPELSSLDPTVCWRWMFSSECPPVLVLLVGLLFIPESPRWLVEQGRAEEALAILTRVDGAVNARGELEEISSAIAKEAGSFAELFKSGLRLALFCAVMLAMLQQFTGASPILFYAPIVFQKAGYEAASDAILQSAILLGWNLFCTVMAFWLVERLGRRPLLLLGCLGMALGLASLGLCFHLNIRGLPILLSLFFGIGAYNLSIAPLAWLIMSEIFPTRVRSKAMAIASLALWVAAYAGAQSFPVLIDMMETRYGSPAGTFWLYAVVCVFAVFFGWCIVPETKGKTLEAIGRSWTQIPED